MIYRYLDTIGGLYSALYIVYKYLILYTDPTLVVYGLKLAHVPSRHLFSILMYSDERRLSSKTENLNPFQGEYN